jgi:CHAT domain-containing protein
MQALLSGLDTPISDVAELIYMLKNERLDLFHFACHHRYEGGDFKIGMDGGPFTIDHVRGLNRDQLGSPLIFMNACRTDGKMATFTGVTSWAEAFLNKGAAAFIGSLWEVRDQTAKTFATEFYTAAKHYPLGTAVHVARLAIKDVKRDPTWLAYTLYGDPSAVAVPV